MPIFGPIGAFGDVEVSFRGGSLVDLERHREKAKKEAGVCIYI